MNRDNFSLHPLQGKALRGFFWWRSHGFRYKVQEIQSCQAALLDAIKDGQTTNSFVEIELLDSYYKWPADSEVYEELLIDTLTEEALIDYIICNQSATFDDWDLPKSDQVYSVQGLYACMSLQAISEYVTQLKFPGYSFFIHPPVPYDQAPDHQKINGLSEGVTYALRAGRYLAKALKQSNNPANSDQEIKFDRSLLDDFLSNSCYAPSRICHALGYEFRAV